MSPIGVADAARNNAAWCSAVCGAHGNAGQLTDAYWLTLSAAPPYYPNLVTLVSDPSLALAGVRELERALPAGSWAVKDSFGVLPLETAGFRILFAAEWIVRPTSARRPSPGTGWFRVRSESELAAWERAWGQSASQPPIFLPALLGRNEIAFLAARDAAGEIEAGVVANRAENAVGISNLFVCGAGREFLRAECIEAAADAFPGLPLVGYETGKDLAESRALGFSSLGPLRVWIERV